jgi:NAD(P)-dependent dehydrogenase (short-subunit alcohol dehydrogenase family)
MLEAEAAGLEGSIESVWLDVTDDASAQQCIAAVMDRAGGIDALVNVAGFGIRRPWPTISVEQFKSHLETNLVGMYRMCLAAEPIMRERSGGWIVNVSSDAGIKSAFWEVAYSASKYGVEGMSLGMRLDSQQFGIRVCVVEPGWYAGTEYDLRMISTIDWENPEGPYAELVRMMYENQPKVEAGKPGLEAVGARTRRSSRRMIRPSGTWSAAAPRGPSRWAWTRTRTGSSPSTASGASGFRPNRGPWRDGLGTVVTDGVGRLPEPSRQGPATA